MEIFKRGNLITSWLLETPKHTGEDGRAAAHSQTLPTAESHRIRQTHSRLQDSFYVDDGTQITEI